MACATAPAAGRTILPDRFSEDPALVFGHLEIVWFYKSKSCLAFNVLMAKQILNPEQCHPCASMKFPASNFFF